MLLQLNKKKQGV